MLTDTENVWVVSFIIKNSRGCKNLASEMDQLILKEEIKNRSIKFGFVDIEDEDTKVILKEYVGDIS